MLHTLARGKLMSDKADYKRDGVDMLLHGSLSYSGLAEKREVMVFRGTNLHDDDEPEGWSTATAVANLQPNLRQ